MKIQGLQQSYSIPQHSFVACYALEPKADIGGRQNMPKSSCLVSQILFSGLRFSKTMLLSLSTHFYLG
jgi:hypothetical protein